MGMKKQQINVALACVIHERKILLTKRQEKAQPDIDNKWELPGGKVEFSESPLITVIREVKEETGYEVADPIGLPFPYTVMRQYDDYILHVIILCFECKFIGELGSFIQTQNKIADVQWFDIERIKFLDIVGGSREFISWVLDKREFNTTNYRSSPSTSLESSQSLISRVT